MKNTQKVNLCLTSVYFWTTCLYVFYFIWLRVSGGFTPQPIEDTWTYIEFATAPLSKYTLGSYRTPGYPLLIWLSRFFAPGISAMPYVNFLLLFAAALTFARGLVRFGFSKFRAIFMTLVMTVASEMLLLCSVNYVATDGPAAACLLAATGCFCSILREKPNFLDWFLLGFWVFAAYQIRPVYIFLLVAFPVITLFVTLFIFPQLKTKARFQKTAGVVLVSVVPFLLYSTFRWFLLGSFGLVSFGGTTAMGIAGQFLDEKIVDELPIGQRPLALAIVNKVPEAIKTFGPCGSSVPGSAAWGKYNVHAHIISARYNCIAFGAALPVAMEFSQNEVVKANKLLGALAREILKVRWRNYCTWIYKASWDAVVDFLGRKQVAKFIVFILAVYWLLLVGRALHVVPSTTTYSQESVTCLHLFTVIATLIYFFKMLLVLMLEPVLTRYVSAAAFLWFAAWGAGCLMLLEQFTDSTLVSKFRKKIEPFTVFSQSPETT